MSLPQNDIYFENLMEELEEAQAKVEELKNKLKEFGK